MTHLWKYFLLFIYCLNFRRVKQGPLYSGMWREVEAKGEPSAECLGCLGTREALGFSPSDSDEIAWQCMPALPVLGLIELQSETLPQK